MSELNGEPDWPTTARVILRLDQGWELYDDDGTWRWYSPTKPGFDDELPTEAEVAFLLSVREMTPGVDEYGDIDLGVPEDPGAWRE